MNTILYTGTDCPRWEKHVYSPKLTKISKQLNAYGLEARVTSSLPLRHHRYLFLSGKTILDRELSSTGQE